MLGTSIHSDCHAHFLDAKHELFDTALVQKPWLVRLRFSCKRPAIIPDEQRYGLVNTMDCPLKLLEGIQ